MTEASAALFLILIAILVANLPWMSERVMFIGKPVDGHKRAAWRWLEWLLLYFIIGAMALGLEHKVTGQIYPQSWEFYAVTLCLFLVFALPGFLYRHDLLHKLARR
jgi:hypothetical protein